jgi:hypothetical protein
MSLDLSFYGSVAEGSEYFAMRLHEFAWSDSTHDERQRALYAATQVIDSLNFKGCKHAVWLLKQEPGCATDEAIREAEATQPLEYPRGADESVPEIIKKAVYEIAHSLLEGKDPEAELENLGIQSQGYASVRTTYARNQVPIEHIVNGIPNALAWRWLRPFLRDDDAIKLSRVS